MLNWRFPLRYLIFRYRFEILKEEFCSVFYQKKFFDFAEKKSFWFLSADCVATMYQTTTPIIINKHKKTTCSDKTERESVCVRVSVRMIRVRERETEREGK